MKNLTEEELIRILLEVGIIIKDKNQQLCIESYDFIRFIVLLEEEIDFEIPDQILGRFENSFKELIKKLEAYGVSIIDEKIM